MLPSVGPAQPVAGRRFGDRYRLDERIGAGGMGEVWRATDEVLGRSVAVKLMLPSLLGDPGFVRRFLAEARAMASVNHPGVVAIHDYRSDADGAFLVMEFVQSEALSQVLGRVGRLHPNATMDLVAQAADALQAAHDKGIVHRDVKPANLLLRPDGTLVLTDFGIAHAQTGTVLTTAGAILGTPSYLAPEQVLGHNATVRSDVYALGLVAYECLTGRRPFDAESPIAAAMLRVQQPPPPLSGDLPGPMVAVVERALAVDPADRWPSAAAFAHAARQAAAGLSAPRPRRTGTAPAKATHRRRYLMAALATFLGLALVVSAIVIATRHPRTEQPQGLPQNQQTLTPTQPTPSASGPAPTAPSASASSTTATRPATAAPQATAAPAGFGRCGAIFCPAAPMCWGGLNISTGAGRTPTPIPCTEPHYWETFAGAYLPAGAEFVNQPDLIKRPDIAVVCSVAVLAARSLNPSYTLGWQREPWPVQVSATTWIFYCMSAPVDGGERTTFPFKTAGA